YRDVARTTGIAAPGPRHSAGAVRLPSPRAAGQPLPAGAETATSTELPPSLRNCPATRAGQAPDEDWRALYPVLSAVADTGSGRPGCWYAGASDSTGTDTAAAAVHPAAHRGRQRPIPPVQRANSNPRFR